MGGIDLSIKESVRHWLQGALGADRYDRWNRGVRRLASLVVGGSAIRERVLIRLFNRYYCEKIRREWALSKEPPHYTDFRATCFQFGFGQSAFSPLNWSRCFYNAEILRDSDVVLDIGCGDGFTTRRFFAPCCFQVDALDVEPSAIATAKRHQALDKITYHLMDAVQSPFPRERYNVVIWDGALGHFPPETTALMMQKIRNVLTPDGIFVGSESLGHEGGDHLQYFETLEELAKSFTPHFEVVAMKEHAYRIGRKGEFLRREAYWRCSASAKRFDAQKWRSFTPS